MSESPDRLSAATDHEVRSVIECYRDRFNDGDADGLAHIYTSDISFVNLRRVPFAGRDASVSSRPTGSADRSTAPAFVAHSSSAEHPDHWRQKRLRLDASHIE